MFIHRVVLGIAVLAAAALPPAQTMAKEGHAPLHNKDGPGAIADQYIVLFKPGTRPWEAWALKAKVKRANGKILIDYDAPSKGSKRRRSGPRGFAVHCSKRELQMILKDPHVRWVEEDQKITSASTMQTAPSRGIDRIDRRRLPLNGTFQYSETGQGVHVYVFDTGIRTTHKEFGNRVTGGHTVIDDRYATNDCHGHGTHVAATIGGEHYGVARKASLHAVRVIGCDNSGTLSGLIEAVQWVTDNRNDPAVANLSIIAGSRSPSLDEAIQDSIRSGVTYVVAAGNRADDACNYSPAAIPEAITVGATTITGTSPLADTRFILSNHGRCLDLFAPGAGILSAWNGSDTATAMKSGTSMAAAHVTGVAALYLELNPFATPAEVWDKIHSHNSIFGSTHGWGGVRSLNDSPNELLYWGDLNDGYNDGDSHVTTVDGAHYNFQGAGEFVLLRGGGVEIQIRQTPVPTMSNPGLDPYHGLATCGSLNTAIAARVGSHRVTYQPNAGSAPGSMQLRIDGNPAPLNEQGMDLPGGGRVVKTAVGDGLEIQFPDDTVLTAVPGWWSSQQTWFLNVNVNRTRATDGIMGAIAQGSWLPALPDGRSLGPMPQSLQRRFSDLNQTFANAWRIRQSESLFDYAAGTSTSTFTNANWPPPLNAPCTLAGAAPVTPPPAPTADALSACGGVHDETAKANCFFDVYLTGETAFAQAYLLSQRLRLGATSTVVAADQQTSTQGTQVTFTAIVALLAEAPATSANTAPTGSVQFFVDGSPSSEPIPLDTRGRARWTTSKLPPGAHKVSARYFPTADSPFLTSSSADRAHYVH